MRLWKSKLISLARRGTSLLLALAIMLPCLYLNVFADSWGIEDDSPVGDGDWVSADGDQIVLAENAPIILRIFMADPTVYDDSRTTGQTAVGTSSERYRWADNSVYLVIGRDSTKPTVPLIVDSTGNDMILASGKWIGQGAFWDAVQRVFGTTIGSSIDATQAGGAPKSIGTLLSKVYAKLKDNVDGCKDDLKKRMPNFESYVSTTTGKYSFIIEPMVGVKLQGASKIHSYWTAYAFIKYALGMCNVKKDKLALSLSATTKTSSAEGLPLGMASSTSDSILGVNGFWSSGENNDVRFCASTAFYSLCKTVQPMVGDTRLTNTGGWGFWSFSGDQMTNGTYTGTLDLEKWIFTNNSIASASGSSSENFSGYNFTLYKQVGGTWTYVGSRTTNDSGYCTWKFRYTATGNPSQSVLKSRITTALAGKYKLVENNATSRGCSPSNTTTFNLSFTPNTTNTNLTVQASAFSSYSDGTNGGVYNGATYGNQIYFLNRKNPLAKLQVTCYDYHTQKPIIGETVKIEWYNSATGTWKTMQTKTTDSKGRVEITLSDKGITTSKGSVYKDKIRVTQVAPSGYTSFGQAQIRATGSVTPTSNTVSYGSGHKSSTYLEYPYYMNVSTSLDFYCVKTFTTAVTPETGSACYGRVSFYQIDNYTIDYNKVNKAGTETVFTNVTSAIPAQYAKDFCEDGSVSWSKNVFKDTSTISAPTTSSSKYTADTSSRKVTVWNTNGQNVPAGGKLVTGALGFGGNVLHLSSIKYTRYKVSYKEEGSLLTDTVASSFNSIESAWADVKAYMTSYHNYEVALAQQYKDYKALKKALDDHYSYLATENVMHVIRNTWEYGKTSSGSRNAYVLNSIQKQFSNPFFTTLSKGDTVSRTKGTTTTAVKSNLFKTDSNNPLYSCLVAIAKAAQARPNLVVTATQTMKYADDYSKLFKTDSDPTSQYMLTKYYPSLSAFTVTGKPLNSLGDDSAISGVPYTNQSGISAHTQPTVNHPVQNGEENSEGLGSVYVIKAFTTRASGSYSFTSLSNVFSSQAHTALSKFTAEQGTGRISNLTGSSVSTYGYVTPDLKLRVTRVKSGDKVYGVATTLSTLLNSADASSNTVNTNGSLISSYTTGTGIVGTGADTATKYNVSDSFSYSSATANATTSLLMNRWHTTLSRYNQNRNAWHTQYIGDDYKTYYGASGTNSKTTYTQGSSLSWYLNSIPYQLSTNFANLVTSTKSAVSVTSKSGTDKNSYWTIADLSSGYGIISINPLVKMAYHARLAPDLSYTYVLGDVLRQIKPVAYTTASAKGTVSSKLTGTAVANDSRAKTLQSLLGENAPVLYSGSGITVGVQSNAEAVLQSAVLVNWLDNGSEYNNTVMSAWKNTFSVADAQDYHNQFMKDRGKQGTGTSAYLLGNTYIKCAVNNGVKEVEYNIQNSAAVKATYKSGCGYYAYLTVKGGKIVGIKIKNLGTGTLKNKDGSTIDISKVVTGTSTSATLQSARKAGWLDVADSLDKMNISSMLASTFASGEGNKVASDNNDKIATGVAASGTGWYNEDTTALALMINQETYTVPATVFSDKLPITLGPKTQTVKDNQFTTGYKFYVRGMVTKFGDYTFKIDSASKKASAIIADVSVTDAGF